MHKTTLRVLTGLLFTTLLTAATACAPKPDGAWAGVCQFETSIGGAPAGAPEERPVRVTATPGSNGTYALAVSIGTNTTCQHAGARTRQENGKTELAFAAMPCVQVNGSSGGNGHFTLWVSRDGAKLFGGVDGRGMQMNVATDCTLSH